MGIPFIVLADVGLWANLKFGDIAVLVKDMHKVVRSDPEDRILTLLNSTTHDCWSLSSPSGCAKYFSARMSNCKQTKFGCY